MPDLSPPPRTADSTGFWDDPMTGKSYCYTCKLERDEHDFGEFLAHLLDEPLEVGRDLQRRIVKRIEDLNA